MSQGDKSTCLIFNILFTLILEILMIDCLINMPSQERKTNLEKRLKEIRQRELKEKGIKPEKTPLDSSQKTLII